MVGVDIGGTYIKYHIAKNCQRMPPIDIGGHSHITT